MQQLTEMKMVEPAGDSNYWTQLLGTEEAKGRRTGHRESDALTEPVFRFCSWTCREV